MNTYRSLIILSLLAFSTTTFAQIYGNTDATDYGGFGANQMTWFKIITGPTDSGSFTHYGLYDHPTTGNTCEVKFSVYSDHPTWDRPQNLLAQDYLPSPNNGVWNEHPVEPLVTITPNTTYWIGLRFNCDYGSGRKGGTIWANQPLRYYDSYGFFSPWPNPVSSSPSSFGNVNNVGLYLVGNNQTLPVELLSFEATAVDKSAALIWEVASELNNAGWNVQRSSNGFTWSDIGWGDGNGTTDGRASYSYKDEQLKEGITFYRLEQVDFDGQTAYSEVRRVEHVSRSIDIFPNPAGEHITITGVEGVINYGIYDAMGKEVSSGIYSAGESLSLEHLHVGVYFISVKGETLRFVKQ